MKVSDFANNGNVDIKELEKLISEVTELRELIKADYIKISHIREDFGLGYSVHYTNRSIANKASVLKAIVEQSKELESQIIGFQMEFDKFSNTLWYKLYKIFNK
jgi:hypothetical protein